MPLDPKPSLLLTRYYFSNSFPKNICFHFAVLVEQHSISWGPTARALAHLALYFCFALEGG